MEFDLYFDESGRFEDSPLVAQNQPKLAQKQKWPSQLVGILAPAGKYNEGSAEAVLAAAHRSAGLKLTDEFHTTELTDSDTFQNLVKSACEQIVSSGFQAVRLTNNARLGFGDKTATYTNMVAEFVIRILEGIQRTKRRQPIDLNIVAAGVLLDLRETGEPVFLEEPEYTKRITEHLAFSAVRRGVAVESSRWQVKSFRFGSGRRHRTLQLCDLLSNASHDSFKRCEADVKQLLLDAFGSYDFNFSSSDTLTAVDDHVGLANFVHALQIIAEAQLRGGLTDDFGRELEKRKKTIINLLAQQQQVAVDANLRQMVDWVRQVFLLRNLPLSSAIVSWLEQNVAVPLARHGEEVSANTAWFAFALSIRALAICNHSGQIRGGKTQVEAIRKKLPAMAGRWESAPLIMEAFIIQAVHLIDCFAFDEAASLMKTVASYYENLTSLMEDAMPGVFPERVRSYDLASAFGTWLQAEMLAGIADPARLARARELNEKAIQEFTSEGDRSRQYQYRSQIETLAGDYSAARGFLARSIGSNATDHTSLAAAIRALPFMQAGFALLHWTRIGLEAARQRNAEEVAAFLEALEHSGLLSHSWVKGEALEYPAHDIRRHLAAFLATIGNLDGALSLLGLLRALPTDDRESLCLITLAGCAEVAAHVHTGKPHIFKKLMESTDEKKPGALRQCRDLSSQVLEFPQFASMVAQLEERIRALGEHPDEGIPELVRVCRLVG
jgi:hypothetical protein